MFRAYVGQVKDQPEVRFPVLVWSQGRQREVTLKGTIGSGDDGEPVITIMLPFED
ncbi:MAG: DUF6573 family protein [Candidatus Bipolaricaulia bacterium]